MASGIARGEVCLRVSVILVLVLTACLVAFDTQTKVIILTIEKKATYTDMDALKILVYITSAAAGYNMLQLCRHCVLACFGGNSRGFNSIYMAWVCLLLDQMAMYMTLAANSATVEGSALALGGSKALEWMKVCNKFTRFCNQIGGAVLCGYLAFILLALISSLSAYNLFRFYSPKWFLRLKSA